MPAVPRGIAPPPRPLRIDEVPRPVTSIDIRENAGVGGTLLLPKPQPSVALPVALAPSAEAAQAIPVSTIVQPPEGDREVIRKILDEAAARIATIDSFQARLTRRQAHSGQKETDERISFRFRKDPRSVHLKWIGEEGRGREILWVKGRYNDELQILTARGDMFPFSPSTRLSFSPDDPLVRSKCKQDIRKAGLEEFTARLEAVASSHQVDRLKYLGRQSRPEFAEPMHAIEEKIPAGEESGLPRGGRRVTYFDASSGGAAKGLPLLGLTIDRNGRTVEYFCFDRFQHPVQLDESDFDATRLGK